MQRQKYLLPAGGVLSGEVLSREDVPSPKTVHCYRGCFMVSPNEILLTAITITG